MDFSTDNLTAVGRDSFTAVSRVSASLLVVAVLQLTVIGAILAAQLYVLMTAGRYLHTAPWLSMLWIGIPHTLRYGQILYNLEDFLNARNIVTMCLVGLSTCCLLLKYHYMENTEGALYQSGLFCRPAGDMLPVFAQEYFTLYIPSLVIGIILRTLKINGDRPSCQECKEWDNIQRHLLGLYAFFLLILRPIQIYYFATLDFQYSDVLLSHVNLISFLYVCMETVKVPVPAKQCSDISQNQ
ncbi:uncharacterized protein LOC130051894 isoform X2 [Ostrea edulis]|uniref:uncharacterized protein LOC130051894 isoform X2 n=1 Tax=Ostrea edulis TaxID=37623 RepID=UPI0024AFFFAF|nr:uncharacterized protein LOC130051894 isoform X2 [Ostrea edulis]